MSRIIPDSSKKLLQFIRESITIDEPEEEIGSLALYITQHLFAFDQNDIILDRSVNLTSAKLKTLDKFIKRINNNEPIQYIMGEADFYGRTFIVNPSVLIPRPETEELVQLIINDHKGKKVKFLDVGTGSGCIVITLLKELSGSKGYAVDIDPRVIRTAKQNAQQFDVTVDFLLMDILSEKLPLQGLDFIVSNPPYVTQSDKNHMKANVVDFEPARALFVTDEDPLIFYRRIAEQAASCLRQGGKLYFEVNEKYADDVKTMLEVMDYEQVASLQDIYGKYRIVQGQYLGDALT